MIIVYLLFNTMILSFLYIIPNVSSIKLIIAIVFLGLSAIARISILLIPL